MKKPEYTRGIRNGEICRGVQVPDEVISRVSYEGNPVHKDYKSKWGPPAKYADKAKCDKFDDPSGELLANVIREAIREGYVGQLRGEFPSRAWAWINDVLHEARLTNQESGTYHGYPLDNDCHYPEPKEILNEAPRVNITVL